MIYGYTRTNNVNQVNECNSLEKQKKLLIENGVSKENIYQDICSGIKVDRPGFTKLLAQLKEGDTIVVTSIDRLSRDVTIINELFERGVKLNVLNIEKIDNTSILKSIRNVFALFEREAKREGTL